MYDVDGWLWNYQLLNPDGSKRDYKGGRIEGLFHSLGSLSDGLHVGVAESYVTAATCMENTGIACICCFGCNNIKHAITALADRYPKLRFTIFADNDRHLDQNQGVLKALESREIYPGRVSLAIPDFGVIEPSKEASDWNDLIRLKGEDVARSQMLEAVRLANLLP